MKSKILVLLVLIQMTAFVAYSQTTDFTYQGRLSDNSIAPTGLYDFEVRLFDLQVGGTQQGPTLQTGAVQVTNGMFTLPLNFGNVFTGSPRFLNIAVRPTGPGAYTPLAPRQPITSTPYAIRSTNSASADTATTATNTLSLGGVAASQYVVTTDPRMTDSRTPTAGSGNYIQNGTTTQASSNFNVSGTGTANFLNATTQFNLNNVRILSAPANNVFVGGQTGQSNTSGDSNSFFGRAAGLNNTTGGNNSFFGYLAGNTTNTGNGNAFFGYQAGRSNTTGGVNSYFGFNAGEFSTTANYNSFFGFNAGNKTTSEGNSFFGAAAGQNNTSGGSNSFFGFNSGLNNTIGGGNTFIGTSAGQANTTGGGLAFLGFNAGLNNTTGAENAFFGAAAGQFNTTANENSFFGYASGYLTTTGSQNSFFGRQAGSTNTTGFQNSFFGRNAGLSNTTGDNNSFFGTSAGEFTTSGVQNSFFGGFAGEFNTTGSANSFFGFVAGFQNTTGVRNSIFGFDAGRLNQTGNDNASFGYSAGRNTSGSNNAFFGSAAGAVNAAGNSNSFFGRNTGAGNTSGDENSFFGAAAGGFNTTGIRNTAIGFNANVGAGNLSYATAIGADSTVSTSNTIVLGRSNGSDQVVIPGNLVANLPAGDNDYIQNTTSPQSANFSITGHGYVGGNLAIRTTSAVMPLDVRGSMVLDNGAIYTAASGGEQNRYLALVNSPTTQTASGLKAGGVLVSDDYFYANPAKNNLIVKGRVGIGKSDPIFAQLDVQSTDSGGRGIFAKGNIGVWGESDFTSSGAGVYGSNNLSNTVGHAGFFNGRVHVSGTLSKSGGSFKIDHPLDPANKYLSHSFVESPDMMNIYNGNVVTDEQGERTVTMPDYFAALNRDFRYQLTVIGQFAQAIVLEKVKGNQFKIKTDKPNVEVSWQVTGIRQDVYANENRILVEEDKLPTERGLYLYPKGFNQGVEKSVFKSRDLPRAKEQQ